MVAWLPGLLTESVSKIFILPLRVMPLCVHDAPKSITIVFGNPEAGVMVTVAQGIILVTGSGAKLPATLLSCAIYKKTSSAS